MAHPCFGQLWIILLNVPYMSHSYFRINLEHRMPKYIFSLEIRPYVYASSSRSLRCIRFLPPNSSCRLKRAFATSSHSKCLSQNKLLDIDSGMGARFAVFEEKPRNGVVVCLCYILENVSAVPCSNFQRTVAGCRGWMYKPTYYYLCILFVLACHTIYACCAALSHISS